MTAVQHEDHIRGLEDAIHYLDLIQALLSNRIENDPRLTFASESVQDVRESINRILDDVQHGAA